MANLTHDGLIKRLTRRIKAWTGSDPVAYWERRANKYGSRSVLDIRYTEEELPHITRKQKDVLYPQFRRLLNGTEEVVLDFGCGTGRFTADLAEIVQGRAVGVDPVAVLLDMAPDSPRTRFDVIRDGRIPLESDSVDVVWICLVFGSITNDEMLRKAVSETERVLRPGGLVFQVINSSRRRNKRSYKYRGTETYLTLFPNVPLQHIHDYQDMGETISVLAGRMSE